MSEIPTPLQRTGRGGAGNFVKPLNDPENAVAAKGIKKDTTPAPTSTTRDHSTPSASKVGYVHHGRGGAGNLSTTSQLVQPVQSVLAPKTEVKPAKGRGGAGNIESASAELATGTDAPKVVNVPSPEAEKAGDEVTEPAAAHLA